MCLSFFKDFVDESTDACINATLPQILSWNLCDMLKSKDVDFNI